MQKLARAAAAPASAANSPGEQIARLQRLAYNAYTKGSYADPPEVSSIAYSKQVLALDPTDSYAKTLLENSVTGGKYQVHQAILRKDFASAQRVAGAMAQLLPGRNDVAGLKGDIASAHEAGEAARHPRPTGPAVSFRAYHMHSEKAPADRGPYCLGILSVTGGHLLFTGETSTDGQTHTYDFACSEIREIKKNARVAAHQSGFHVRAASFNNNFVPEDSSPAHLVALAAACSK